MKRMFQLALMATIIASLVGVVEAKTPEVTVVFHGGVHGEIDDCGCKRNPLGGVAQRAAHLQGFREGGTVALADAGNMFGKPTEEGRRQTDFLVQETAQLGYDAIGVGPWDLNYGIDYLRSKAERLPFTSANLMVDGELLFAPYLTSEHDGVTFGWVSVIDPDHQLNSMGELAGVTMTDPVAALDELLPALRAEVDVLVLLANFRQGELSRRLQSAANAWQVDLAVDGASTYHYNDLKHVEGTTLLAANARGKYLGSLRLTFGDDGNLDQEYELVSVKPRGKGPSDDAIAARVEDFLTAQKAVASNQD